MKNKYPYYPDTLGEMLQVGTIQVIRRIGTDWVIRAMVIEHSYIGGVFTIIMGSHVLSFRDLMDWEYKDTINDCWIPLYYEEKEKEDE